MGRERMTDRMIVYLIRHGETDYNRQGRLQGHTDIPLNEYGRQLAEITARALADVPFDHVFCSPLIRAVETARIIVGSRNCGFEIDPRIQEISFGVYEGLYYGKENFSVPDPHFRQFFDAPQKYTAPPEGEDFRDVIARTGRFWEELMGGAKYMDKTVLISTHGCALKALLANVFHRELKDFWGAGVQRNCAVSIVRVADGRPELVEEGKIFYEDAGR